MRCARTPPRSFPLRQAFATLTGISGAIQQLAIVDSTLIIRTDAGWLASVDLTDGTQTASHQFAGAVDLSNVPATDQVIADPSAVTSLDIEAGLLAKDLGDTVPRIRGLLQASGKRVSIAGYVTATQRDALNKHITDGSLAGITLESGPVVAVSSGTSGVTFLDAIGLRTLTAVALQGAEGMAFVDHGLEFPTLYVAAQAEDGPKLQTIAIRDPALKRPRKLRSTCRARSTTWSGTSPRT